MIKPKPLQAPVEGGFTVDDFGVDEHVGTVTCPAVHTRPITPSRAAIFGKLCRDCPLRARCTTSKTGRQPLVSAVVGLADEGLGLFEPAVMLGQELRRRDEDRACHTDSRIRRTRVRNPVVIAHLRLSATKHRNRLRGTLQGAPADNVEG